MEEIVIKARAKINLALDVLGKRDDGYHDISSVMQTVSLCDTLQIKKIYKPNYGLKLATNVTWLAVDERNLVYRTAAYLKEVFAIETGIFIHIAKEIPTSAGLGGGSADCAATLLGMRKLFKLPLSDDDLMDLAVKFGADVPFCVHGGTAHAMGIGEKLKSLPNPPFAQVLIVKPPVIVSTGEVFAGFTMDKPTTRPDIDKIIHHINQGDLEGMCNEMGNVLEAVTIPLNPQIADIKRVLMAQGAMGAMMTGSGATVFGIFEKHHQMEQVAKAVKATFADIKEIFLTKFEPRRFLR
ncbi:MAG: 4-(cytidine 5'-diphospho)-2-C-methyl-D-erythritol kinase [Defluviitaleaceae bacterium]|nr:4-(cytidine 5'-diphospho)-2-C-methyl-D-erythritol kinase [Defluviitaleaceae bacterium]